MFIKLPVRLREGQICFKIVFYSVLRQTLNNYLFAIFCVNFPCVRGWHKWRLSMQYNELQKFEGEQHLETQLGLVLGERSIIWAALSLPLIHVLVLSLFWIILFWTRSVATKLLEEQTAIRWKFQISSYFIAFYHITMFDTCLFW